ncbi:MAG TPA: VCBS repeat-containing protein [Chthonomonadaceae bacterium]|nr:VCBS repeat-containing protein [Chthonomonadaceae bacterium]
MDSSSLYDGSLVFTGNAAVTTTAEGLDGNSRTYPTLGQDNTEAYFSFLLQPRHPIGAGYYDDYGGISFGNLFVGKGGGSDYYCLENLGGAGHIDSKVLAVQNQTVFLVVHARFYSGNDTFDLYINPTPGAAMPSTPDVTKTDLDLGTVNILNFGTGAAYAVDEIRIGTTWQDVTPAVNPALQPHLFLQNPTTGQLAEWSMNGPYAISGSFITPSQDPNWKAVAEADMNGDGQADILFQNSSTGRLAVWFMNGTVASGGAFISPVPPSGWKVVGMGDFNGDGHSDIVFQNPSTGQIAVWYMNGTAVMAGAYILPTQNPQWQCVGTADFNADSSPDLLFQNSSTGQLAVWFMNGVVASGAAYLTPSQASIWKAAAIADLNADGIPDILFQNTSTGQLVVWFMNGTTAYDGTRVSPSLPSGWQVVGPH